MHTKLAFYLAVGALLLALVIVGIGSHPAPELIGGAMNPTAVAVLVSGGSAQSHAILAAQQATATPTPTSPPEPGVNTIQVWWPDELYPQENGPAEEILLQQFDDFRVNYVIYDLDVRRKRTHGLGGIFPTLRTAGPVAPSAVPDLTLMRRADMVTAATEGLIVPLDDWISPSLVGSNLLLGARALGEIDGVLFGLPYAVTLTHTAYRASVFIEPMISFDDVLTEEPVYVFPAGDEAVNLTVLLQYLAAGGRLADDEGVTVLDREPLVTVLDYYAQGLRKGIFTPSLLTTMTYDDYWNDFVSADANMIGVDSVAYLSHKDSVQNVGLAPIPTLGETPISALDGWVWVLTTTDPDHQEQARAFLSWMMRVSQQSAYTEAFGILPSQTRALRLWDDEAYADFAQELLPDARMISQAQRSSSAAVALQESFHAVIEGSSAGAAADAALAKLLG